jgi:ERCC4-related helicase
VPSVRPRVHRLEEFDPGGGPPTERPPPPARPRAAAAVPGTWGVADGFVAHPLLTPGLLRALPFQIDFARVGLTEDLLVVLPTGLGKTVIAALLSAELLRSGPGKVLLLAPTRPLVQQHAASFARWLPAMRRAVFTGSGARPRREGAWDAADVVFSTPEIIVNDLAADRYDLKGVRLLIFDEVHHAVGHYAYVPLAERYRTERPTGGRILGLTASPGGKDERIEEVVGVLGGPRVEARSREDPGVREFVQAVDVEFHWVDLPPEAKRIQEHLVTATRDVGHKLQKMGYLRKKPLTSLSVKDLIALRGEIFARPGPMTRKFGPLFHQLILLHLHHAQERLETQGISPFEQYVERVRAKPKPSRGDLAFVRRPEVVKAMAEAKAFREESRQASHPKLDALAVVLRAEMAKNPDRPPRVLVFAQYRDTIQGIVERLEGEGWTVGRFVGQSTRDDTDRGMTQGEQSKVLRAFSEGRFPILVASSVAEEGLDVPDVDLVVFFEAVASEIRAIQRRGRTGRSSAGRVLVLLTRETRDVGYQQAEVRREAAMGRVVRRLSAAARRRSRPELGAEPAPEPPPRATSTR